VVVVVGATLVVVVVVVEGLVVVVVVVLIGLQHSYASICLQSPTLGISLCKIRLPGINLPVPSYLTNAFKSFLLDIVINLTR
jgi:hypothetical protein